MPEPKDELVAAIAARVEEALSAQGQNTAGAVADAADAGRIAGNRNQRVLYGGLGGILAMLGTVTGWFMDRVEEWDNAMESQTEILKKLEADEVRDRIIEGDIKAIRDQCREEQIMTYDAFHWVGDKIDAGSARMSKKLKPPRTLERPEDE